MALNALVHRCLRLDLDLGVNIYVVSTCMHVMSNMESTPLLASPCFKDTVNITSIFVVKPMFLLTCSKASTLVVKAAAYCSKLWSC